MITAIIQARMGSTRLPGKSMMEIEGIPMVAQVIRRVKQAKRVRKIILAIPGRDDSSPLADTAWQEGVHCYVAGSTIPENDVLSRFYYAARKHDAEPVVRVTADCPLIDPQIIDRLVDYYMDNQFDFASTLDFYPDGFDTEIFSFAALKLAFTCALTTEEREHVTSYIRKNSSCGRLPYIRRPSRSVIPSIRGHSFSVDTRDDLVFARHVYRRFGPEFTMADVLLLAKEERIEQSKRK
ncbi:MAG: glycosyltransferase family protein [Dehalococcoidia bacterium]|nr:glycosyltransferase family protein [Dehalococcoidia bacterium]